MTKRSVAKKPKLTKWFAPHIKPVHVGWYQTGWGDYSPLGKRGRSPFMWWFDGSQWLGKENGDVCFSQNRYWRGLAVKP